MAGIGHDQTHHCQEADFRFGSSLCENSDVELARRNFVSITLNRKRTALAVTVEGGQGRKQFCAFSARARFHTAWAQPRTSAVATVRSALPPITDLRRPPPYVRKVPTGFLAINHQQKIILQPRNAA